MEGVTVGQESSEAEKLRGAKYAPMGWAWVGATFAGYGAATYGQSSVIALLTSERVASSPVGPYVDMVPPDSVGFILGGFLAVLIGEVITGATVAARLKGIILGTKHALAASGGGFLGFLVSQNVAMADLTPVPEFTVSAIGAAGGILLGHFLLPGS